MLVVYRRGLINIWNHNIGTYVRAYTSSSTLNLFFYSTYFHLNFTITSPILSSLFIHKIPIYSLLIIKISLHNFPYNFHISPNSHQIHPNCIEVNIVIPRLQPLLHQHSTPPSYSPILQLSNPNHPNIPLNPYSPNTSHDTHPIPQSYHTHLIHLIHPQIPTYQRLPSILTLFLYPHTILTYRTHTGGVHFHPKIKSTYPVVDTP